MENGWVKVGVKLPGLGVVIGAKDFNNQPIVKDNGKDAKPEEKTAPKVAGKIRAKPAKEDTE